MKKKYYKFHHLPFIASSTLILISFEKINLSVDNLPQNKESVDRLGVDELGKYELNLKEE